MKPAALMLDRFSFAYPSHDQSTHALQEVSLTIEPGEFVLVCGASGSGKSTLLRAAAGLVPHHFGGVATGEASVCGHDLRVHRAAELAAICGTVMQDPEVQVVMGSVLHEIAFPLENFGWDPATISGAVNQTARALKIDRLLNRRTAQLSGGEMQRVVLAAAIAAHPPLMALDEPTSLLDPAAADEFLALLGQLNADRGTTVLLAEHRIERALEYVDRVLVFERGSMVCDAPPPEFLAWAEDRPGHEWLLTPAARLCSLAGIAPLPTDAAQARTLIGEQARESPPAQSMIATDPVESPTRTAALIVRDVSFTFPHAHCPAIDNVGFSIHAGERVALMGANGSGKSTLLRLARGLIRPDTGTVGASGAVGLLLQNPNDYLIHDRVADEAPAEALARFDLLDLADRDPRDLSGGERQRLALAIVMQDRPAVLMLDEPTRGMDRARKSELVAVLRDVARQGTAVVLVTHDVEFAAEFAERVLLLDDGQILIDDLAVTVFGSAGPLATQTASLLPDSGALTPSEGAEFIIKASATPDMTRAPDLQPALVAAVPR